MKPKKLVDTLKMFFFLIIYVPFKTAWYLLAQNFFFHYVLPCEFLYLVLYWLNTYA